MSTFKRKRVEESDTSSSGVGESVEQLAENTPCAGRPSSPPPDAVQVKDDNDAVPLSTSKLAKTGSIQKLPKVEPPNKDQYFMSLALVASCRSRDPSTQVGACLVNANKTKVLGIGYNGAPQRIDDETEMPWPDVLDDHKHKNDFVIHAEANALALSDFTQHQNSVMYCTHYPCKECAKTMLHYGVGTIFYLDDSKIDKADYEPAVRLLDYLSAQKKVAVEKLVMDEKCMQCFSAKLTSTISATDVGKAINDQAR